MALILGRMTFSMRPSKWKKKEPRKFRETGICPRFSKLPLLPNFIPKVFLVCRPCIASKDQSRVWNWAPFSIRVSYDSKSTGVGQATYVFRSFHIIAFARSGAICFSRFYMSPAEKKADNKKRCLFMHHSCDTYLA